MPTRHNPQAIKAKKDARGLASEPGVYNTNANWRVDQPNLANFSAKSNRTYAIIHKTKYQGRLGNHVACIRILSRLVTLHKVQNSGHYTLQNKLFILFQAQVQPLRSTRRIPYQLPQRLLPHGRALLLLPGEREPTGGPGRW